MFPITEFQDCLERVTRGLKSVEVRFYITGGAAFIAYGDPRTTQDVDLVVDGIALQPKLGQLVPEWQREQFLLNEATIREAVRSRRQFQLIDLISTLKIDLYPSDFISGAIDRVREIELFPGVTYPVSSRPDLVVSKLDWIRKGSHKSRRDVKQLWRHMSDDDKEAVHNLAAIQFLTALLDEVLAEPDEIDM